MQPDLPCAAAQPETLTLLTAPDEENVTLARDTSSAPATHALAPPITPPTAAATAPCDGCSGMFWFLGLPAAGSGTGPVCSGLAAPSLPTAFAISLCRSPDLPVGSG